VKLSPGTTYRHALVATVTAGNLMASATWTPSGAVELEILTNGAVVDSGTGTSGVTLTYAAAANTKYVVKVVSQARVTLSVHFTDSHF
jgi:Ethanolamine utilization protein EutJ (predicted chaperonin)